MHVSHCEQRAVGSRNNTTAAPPETQEQGSLCVSPTVWNPSPAAAALTDLSCTLPGQRAPDSSFTVSETGHLKSNNLMTNNFFSCVYVCMCAYVWRSKVNIRWTSPILHLICEDRVSHQFDQAGWPETPR